MFWVKGSRMLWDVSMLLRMACLLKLMNYFQDFPFSMSEIVDHCSLKPEKVKEWIRDGGVGVAAAWTTKTAALVQALALVTSFCPGKTLEGNDRRKVVTKLWPSPNSIPCLVYNLAQPSPQSHPPTSLSARQIPQNPLRFTVAAWVPHSAKEFAKGLCCCYKYC